MHNFPVVVVVLRRNIGPVGVGVGARAVVPVGVPVGACAADGDGDTSAHDDRTAAPSPLQIHQKIFPNFHLEYGIFVTSAGNCKGTFTMIRLPDGDNETLLLAMSHARAIQEHKHRGYPNPDSVEGHLPVSDTVGADDKGIERHTVEEWAKTRLKHLPSKTMLIFTPETACGRTPGIESVFKSLRSESTFRAVNSNDCAKSVPVKVVTMDEVERGAYDEPSEFMAVRVSTNDKVRYFDAQDREVAKVNGQWHPVRTDQWTGKSLYNTVVEYQGARLMFTDGTMEYVPRPSGEGWEWDSAMGSYMHSAPKATGYATGGIAPPYTGLVGESVSAAVRLQKGTAVGKSEMNLAGYQGDLFNGGTATLRGNFTAYFEDPVGLAVFALSTEKFQKELRDAINTLSKLAPAKPEGFTP